MHGCGSLADTVVPISYSIRGTAFACDLWRYKTWHASDASMRTSLLALLLVFLHDHGDCVWRAAGRAAPDRLAVVPSGCGRPGTHPLLRLVAPFLRLPLATLVMRPGEQGRDLNSSRFVAGELAGGENVLLLDDTWVSGASIQSAAVGLKRAGAASVTAMVLGRYVNPADPAAAGFDGAPYDPAKCIFCTKPAIA
jgi:hypothetical protein